MGLHTYLAICFAAVALIENAESKILGRQNGNGSSKTPLDYVDPLIGTINGGHVFAGATLPFAMAKAVGDSTFDNQGGFSLNYSSPVTGFSHMHDSGTGGALSLGNFPLFPHAGCPEDKTSFCQFPKLQRASGVVNGSVVASPGYFGLQLNNSVKAEMTTTNHTALYRFTFAKPADVPLSPLIILDITDLSESRVSAKVAVDPDTGKMSGSGVFKPSFGEGEYTLYFCTDFRGASIRETGSFIGNATGNINNITIAENGNTPPVPFPEGLFTRFDAPDSNGEILARVGLSFISTSQACGNAEKEIPNFDFDETKKAAEEVWEEKLSVISLDATGVSDDFQTIFWSGVYRAMLSPQDYTGENPLWESDEPYYDSYYCIWDSYRSIHPFITLVDPHSQTLMIRSLIEIYRKEGWLPDCRMSLCKGWTQGGSNADVVLADAYIKNITDGIDWVTGYEALVKDAEVEPPNWDVEGRGGLASWKSVGYIPYQDYDVAGVGLLTRSVSRTVEYAYNDFCIAEVAKGLGKQADYEKYTKSSDNWKNLWKADQTAAINGTDTGFVGYLQPKYLNGSWAHQDPLRCSPLLSFESCYLNAGGGEYYEGSAWMYTFYAPHDHAALITTMGGPQAFVDRLDFLHEKPGLLYVGDEQAFLTLFQYHYAGRPAKSAERVHFYIPSQFNASTNGIPGNDDSGAMGSFVALSMLGVFPNPGQDVYFITPPFFPSVSITNKATGKTATIKNVNFDAAYQNIYVQSATLNGQPYTKNYLTHSFFLEGGSLELTLGPKESAWGTAEEDLPPSLSTTSSSL